MLSRDARVGLPVVKLGLIPGAGGTQRLPRLVGAIAALEIIVSGRQLKADEAKALGIADIVATGDLRAEAAALARTLVGKPLRRIGQLPVPTFDQEAFDDAASAVTRKARGQISPVKAAEMVSLAAQSPLAEGLQRERAQFMELMAGSQSRALWHAFFAEREVLRVPSLDDIAPRNIETVGVLGAGTMGAGIAVALSDAGLPVTVVETSATAVEAGQGRIKATYDRMLKSGRIDPTEHARRIARLQQTQAR